MTYFFSKCSKFSLSCASNPFFLKTSHTVVSFQRERINMVYHHCLHFQSGESREFWEDSESSRNSILSFKLSLKEWILQKQSVLGVTHNFISSVSFLISPSIRVRPLSGLVPQFCRSFHDMIREYLFLLDILEALLKKKKKIFSF